MAETVVDALEMIDVEDQHRHRTSRARLAFDHAGAGFGETTAIEHAGQRIHRGCRLVGSHRALRHQHEDHEHGADRIEHELDREQRDPDAGGKFAVGRMQQVAQQDRQHQHETVQHRHHDRRPVPLQSLAPFRPQFGGGQRRIERDDACADRGPERRFLRVERRDRSDPRYRAQDKAGQVRRAAVEHACGIPDHAASDEADRVECQRKHLTERAAGKRPQRHRGRAEQIGIAPPFQGRIVLLVAEEQQHQPEQGRDHGGDEIKCNAIERHRSSRVFDAAHPRKNPDQVCALSTSV